jgi:hypothetical protein
MCKASRVGCYVMLAHALWSSDAVQPGAGLDVVGGIRLAAGCSGSVMWCDTLGSFEVGVLIHDCTTIMMW